MFSITTILWYLFFSLLGLYFSKSDILIIIQIFKGKKKIKDLKYNTPDGVESAGLLLSSFFLFLFVIILILISLYDYIF